MFESPTTTTETTTATATERIREAAAAEGAGAVEMTAAVASTGAGGVDSLGSPDGAAAPDGSVTIDQLEDELVTWEAVVSHARARQAALLRRLDALGAPAVDGARSLTEWTAGRVDLEVHTARTLVTAAERLVEHPHLDDGLASGAVTFDRAAATMKLAAAGASDDAVEASFGFDLTGVARATSRRGRIRRSRERRDFAGRFWATQPSRDEGNTRFWGELPAAEMDLVDQALRARADALPPTPEGCSDGQPQRLADALVAMSLDTTDPVDGTDGRNGDGNRNGSGTGTGGGGGRPLATVFVDGELAASTGGETGAEIAFGPRVGPDVLDQILCSGAVQLVGLQDGRPVSVTDETQAIPPAVRRYVLWRDGGCTYAGCTSRYRLQPHHIRHRRHGGTNHPDNLTTLCWFHHHVIIHRHGHRLDPTAPPQRRRFLRNHHHGPAPPRDPPPARHPDPDDPDPDSDPTATDPVTEMEP